MAISKRFKLCLAHFKGSGAMIKSWIIIIMTHCLPYRVVLPLYCVSPCLDLFFYDLNVRGNRSLTFLFSPFFTLALNLSYPQKVSLTFRLKKFAIWLLFVVGAIRLVVFGKLLGSIGSLEIYHSGKWGTVCDDYFNSNAARVVCRQLGYSYLWYGFWHQTSVGLCN